MAYTEKERLRRARAYRIENSYSKHVEFSVDVEHEGTKKFKVKTYGEPSVFLHKRYWDDFSTIYDPINERLKWAENKSDIAHAFRRFYRQQIEAELEQKNKNPSVDESHEEIKATQALLDERIEELGFVESDTSKSYDRRYKHKLTVSKLKDLFRDKISPEIEEEVKEYENWVRKTNEKAEDKKARSEFVRRVQFFYKFIDLFEARKDRFREDINQIHGSIGRGNFEGLARSQNTDRNPLYPKHALTSSFRQLEYAKEWLELWEPIADELQRLRTALNAPLRLSEMGTEKAFTHWYHVDIVTLANFDYQGFLIYLLDFRKRFGKKSRYYNSQDSEVILSGEIMYKSISDYERDRFYRADEWNPLEEILQSSHYSRPEDKKTFNQALNEMLEQGKIYTISSAGRMAEIMKYVNSIRHQQNVAMNRYKRTPFIQVKVSDEEHYITDSDLTENANRARWKL